MIEDPAILAEFATESREHLADVEILLLAIETASEAHRAEAVNSVFRAVHSIKGAAGFLGLTKIGELSHSLENVLNQMRNGDLSPNSDTINLLLRSCDLLRTLVELVANQKDDSRYEIRAFVEALDAIFEKNKKDKADGTLSRERSAAAVAVPVPAPAATLESNPHGAEGASTNIRVPVGVLDRLMNLAGELVLSRNQLLQAVSAVRQPGLEATTNRLDQVTSELQEAIMQTRMQPLAQVFNRLPRVVRDLSGKLGKQVELEVHGKEVEVDKTIIEAISDPLIHLVRNSLDHGIESPDVRISRGKRSTGTITVEASHQAGRVNILLRDDGAGIDPVKLKTKAVAKGIITAEEAAALSDREAVELVFHPGFSTAEAVTDVSGRGVGMDVVKSNIAQLGGTVEISSQVGRGTDVQIKLPLTLAIIPSLIVRSGNQRFAISQASIQELVRVKASELTTRVSTIKGAEVLRLRGKLLPLVRLSKLLGVKGFEANTSSGLEVIVVEGGGVRFGMIVDGLDDSEEIVVKPLGQHLKCSTCLAGAAVLGDGEVALILDAAGVAAFARLAKTDDEDSEEITKTDTETQPTLLFSNHGSEMFGIPMAVIKRVERIETKQIELIGGQLVYEYTDGSLPLIALEDQIRALPRPELARMYIAIFEFNREELAVIVPSLSEIRELPLDIDTRTFREPGVLGSVVMEKQAIRLLDVFQLAAKAYPQLAEAETQAVAAAVPSSYRILVAEDSAFFRSQVISFLESKGYEVVGAADGELGWETLQEADPPIDLVLTDIEMPNLNGFEFCERIRRSEAFSDLPVVALTSLAAEEDMERGRQAGVSDYQVKMDRDRLLATVAKLLKDASRTQRQLAMA